MKNLNWKTITIFSAVLAVTLAFAVPSQAGSNWSFSLGNGHSNFTYGHGHQGHLGHGHGQIGHLGHGHIQTTPIYNPGCVYRPVRRVVRPVATCTTIPNWNYWGSTGCYGPVVYY